MEQRALALDEQHLAPAPTPSSTSCSAAPAMKSATTASTEIPQPGDRDPRLAGRDELAADPARRASRSSSSATVIFPIAQSEPTVRIDVAPWVRFSPVGHVEAGRRLAQVAQLDAVLRARGRELGVVRQTNSCRPFSTSSPARMHSSSSSRHAGGKRPPCVATPTSAVVGPNGSASATVPTIGKPSCVSRRSCESRMHDDVLGRGSA